MLFILETKISSRRIERLKVAFDFPSCFAVEPVSTAGGLAMFWSDFVNVSLVSWSKGHIDVSFSWSINQIPIFCYFTTFNGNQDVHLRPKSWKLLSRIGFARTEPWICCGDFIEILFQWEKQGCVERNSLQIQQFRNAIDEVHLKDLGYRGNPFIWCNAQEEPYRVGECLDRAFANDSWQSLFPYAQVEHGIAKSSNHMSIILAFYPKI